MTHLIRTEGLPALSGLKPGADVFIRNRFAPGDGILAVPHLALKPLAVADQVVDGFFEQLVGTATGATQRGFGFRRQVQFHNRLPV